MTSTSDHESQFAELLDELLDQVQNGDEPDVEAVAARHPAVAHRVDEALKLAGSLAGRKLSSRPSLPGYEIVRELGRGGMGTVYLARQISLQREIALKVLPHSFGLSAASRQRFLEEARALAHVKHEHIVDIHRIVDDGELLAFEMEFVDGPSLHTVLAALREHRERTGAAPSLAQVTAVVGLPIERLGARNLTLFFVRLVHKIARALAAVHAAGFVHRDVKPANVLLRKNGDPVVVDFGLVRLHGLEVTQAGRFAGTPVYSSPEQLRGEVAVGPASDVYSLGVTLYECLTLATPFAGRTTTDLLQRIEQGRFRPLRRLAPDAPRDLETIVAHAMEIDPRQRYANAGELADDLQRLLELRPIQARPEHPLRRLGKLLRRNRKPLLAAAVGAVVVAAALFPILHQVEAASRALELAARNVRTAREHVIEVDSGSVEWRHTIWGSTTRPRLDTTARQSQPLRAALEQYDRAIALAPADAVAQQERAVVELAIWLQQLTVTQVDMIDAALTGREFATITAPLGPVTVAVARMLADPKGKEIRPVDVEAASNDDRKTLGLLAYLFGDFQLCELAWAERTFELVDEPLIDAGLGRLLLADGRLEPAYARLLQAQREFPTSTALTSDLADAALRLGDLALARQWLARLPEAPQPHEPVGGSLARRRLELDVRAANELGSELIDAYEDLVRRDPYDPTARHRLAQLAMRRGDLATAAKHLDTLLRSWPEAATFRLDRARVALQRRDLAAYAQQVLAVLQMDYGSRRSRGTTADLLEILRIGGLERLYIDGVVASGQETAGRALFGGEIAIQSFAPRTLTRDFEGFARFFDRLRRQVQILQGPERRLDELSTHLLLALPLALNQLPAGASLTPLQRLLIAPIPWLGPEVYERVMPTVRLMLLNLQLPGWRTIGLAGIQPPELPPSALFGGVLQRVDDCTDDDFADLLVACSLSDPGNGTPRILLVDGRSREVIATMVSESRQHLFGHSIAAIDDLDDDGSEEWLFGCPSGSQEIRQGRLEIWSSRTRRPLWVMLGAEPGFGASVAGLGDCDGDGCPDFAVATPPLLRNQAAQGRVQLFSGRTRQLLATWRNEVPGVWFGASIATVGDADGDGVDDLAVGGNYGSAPGLVCLYSGRTHELLHTWSDPSTTSGFGKLVTAAGDVDGDGRADVIVTALDFGKTDVDRVFVYSGRTGHELAMIAGDRPGTGFGHSVVRYSGTGGETVLAIGSPSGGDPVTGRVELHSLVTGRVASLFGPSVRGVFGWAIALVDDDDGDGLPELFVSAPSPSGMVWRAPSSQWLTGFLPR